MDIVVAYDVNTETPEGRGRLRRVAKVCLAYGQRVQYSVFECSLSNTNLERLRQRLLKTINTDEDSLRIYFLHGKREDAVEVHGQDCYRDLRDPLVF